MQIKIFIHKDQLYNFLILKEPVTLINEIINSDYFEMMCSYKELEFTEYRTYMTVEIKKSRLEKRKLRKGKRK